MKAPLSHYEMELLDHQMSKINADLENVVNLLEQRLGEADELTASGRVIEQGVSSLAMRVHKLSVIRKDKVKEHARRPTFSAT